jgi:hypothetical protein
MRDSLTVVRELFRIPQQPERSLWPQAVEVRSRGHLLKSKDGHGLSNQIAPQNSTMMGHEKTERSEKSRPQAS